MNTYMANPDKIERKWMQWMLKTCQTLGCFASEVAKVLRGKTNQFILLM